MSGEQDRHSDTMWRSGYGGSLERLEELDGRFPGWHDVDLEVRDAAHVFEEVLGDRRRRETDADPPSSGRARGSL